MRTTQQYFTSGAAALALAGMAAGLSGSAPGAPVARLAGQPPAPVAPVAAAVVSTVADAAPPARATEVLAAAEAALAAIEAAAPAAPVAAAPEPEPAPAAAPVLVAAAVPAQPARNSFADLRSRVRWMRVQVNGRDVLTPDPDSRLLLARSAAERARLAEVGLDFRDVYGVITAETSWVPRTGMGRNGVASHGLAQFEPATARALGVRNPNDPVEAVHGAALLLREAASWSARRIAGLRLGGAEYASRLREGISVYYNLSSRARQRWNGASHSLPVETRRHISNVRAGIRQAERLQTGTGPSAQALAADAAATVRASGGAQPRAAREAATPRPVGTISWSGQGGDASGASRAGTHVVWSDGAVTRDGGGRMHWSSRSPG